MSEPLRIVILGLSITSSWGNEHATIYRSLMRALVRRGHNVTFLERDVPWYAENRDLPQLSYGQTYLYSSPRDLEIRFGDAILSADLVIVGSYVPEGVTIGNWIVNHSQGLTAFYDIDTPLTLAKLAQGDYQYLSPSLIFRYDLYLSLFGGAITAIIESRYGSPMARPLYCSVDPDVYYPEQVEHRYDLGYLGDYSEDHQPTLERLLLEPARRWPEGRFLVVGSQYPTGLVWPENVEHCNHLALAEHRTFYNSQRFTLNITHTDMVRAGYSPTLRLFEAAACATPIISDFGAGLETFFTPSEEILIVASPEDTMRILQNLTEEERQTIGARSRERVLAAHTSDHRAAQLEAYVAELRAGTSLKERYIFG